MITSETSNLNRIWGSRLSMEETGENFSIARFLVNELELLIFNNEPLSGYSLNFKLYHSLGILANFERWVALAIPGYSSIKLPIDQNQIECRFNNERCILELRPGWPADFLLVIICLSPESTNLIRKWLADGAGWHC